MTQPRQIGDGGVTGPKDLISDLNRQQREAVLASEGPVLILAGAGSGKTRVITHRVAWLILDRGVAPDRILAVTFTNKAAGEMKARAEALLPGTPLTSWISTFHSLCVRILRREAEAAGLDRDFTIYDTADQLAAVREAMKAADLPEKLHPPRRVQSWISRRKNRPRRDATAEDDDHVYARVAELYAAALERASALDFDDLLLRTVALFDRNADVRDRYQQRFLYVLVDEYQDTNRVQYDLVRHLVGPRGNLTVVGDEDQSIYSWRGADIQNILDFESDFPGARVLRLEENYRSSQAILDAASALVAHNRRRKGKVLRAVQDGGQAVELHQAGDEYEEAAWAVRRAGEGAALGRVAVLYRMNAQSRILEESLMRVGMRYVVVGGVGFYDRREVKDILAYLRLLVNPRDPVAFRRVVNVPPRGIGELTLAQLEQVAREREISLAAALEAVVDEELLPGRTRLALDRFQRLLAELREEAPALGLKRLIERLLERSGYAARLGRDDSRESQDRLENLAELLSAASDYELREEAGSLAGFLERASLLSDVDKVKGEAPVALMTLHSAKGLEFETVLLVGMEEGLMPHSRALENENALEEERRLCYVGMTRAMRRLGLSWAQTRQVFGQRRRLQPSRFLEELPGESLRQTGRAAPTDLPPTALPRRDASRPSPPEAEGSALPEGLRAGIRVRHPLFGVGTVLRSDGGGEDLKLTVSFASVGIKRLVARFARLEVVG